MTDQPTLGQTLAGEPVALDVSRLVGTHLCLQGNSGAGKSRTIRRILEQTHGALQHIVLDVEDEFYTLRQRHEYVIAGGDGGDCPATPDNAAQLARVLLEHGLSAIVQINDLGLDGRRAFVRLFLEALIGAPRQLWHPALVVLDEADRYAPQEGKAESLPAVVALMAMGRKRGFTGLLATQRLAKISKDATGDVNNWLMGRVGQTTDRRAVAEALGFPPSSGDARALQGLPVGHFWGFGPAIAPVPVLVHVGPVETTHLRAGQAKVPTPPPPEALREILAGLAAAPAAAETEEAAAAPADAAAVAAAERRGQVRGLERGRWEGRRQELEKHRKDVEAVLLAIEDRLEAMGPPPGAAVDGPAATDEEIDAWIRSDDDPPPPAPPPAVPPRNAQKTPAPQGSLPPARQRILDALAWLESVGIRQAARAQVAFLAGASAKSSAFEANVAAARAAGHLTYPGGGDLALTDAGRAVAKAPERPITTAALHEMIRAKLRPSLWRLLAVLIERHPAPVARADLAEAAGVSARSSAFEADVSELRSFGFVDYPAPGLVKAEPILFIRTTR